MTIIANRGLTAGLSYGLIFTLRTDARCELIVYKGTAPADPNDYVEATYTSDVLATFESFSFSIFPSNEDVGFRTLGNTPSPNPVTATGTGTATWFAMHVTYAYEASTIGDLSTTAGTAPVRLDSLSITSGNPVTWTYCGFRFVL